MTLTRRQALARACTLPLTTMPLFMARLGLAHASTPSLAIVMNSGAASVSIIDMATRQVLQTLPTFREPSHWALSPARDKPYIADASGNALFILDPSTGAVLGHKRVADPYQLGFTPDGQYLIINALRLDYVDIYRAGDLALAKRFSAGSMPSHLDCSPDSRWSFSSMQKSNSLVSFDLTTMTVRWKSKIGHTPAGVLWHNGKILVCIMGSDHVAEVDPVTGAVLRRAKTGIGPHNVFLTPDGARLYVTNRVGGTLAALDPVTLTLRRTYPLHNGGPDDMGVAPDGKLWITLRFREQVAVLDPESGDYDTIDVGRSPHDIFLTTEMQRPGIVTAEML